VGGAQARFKGGTLGGGSEIGRLLGIGFGVEELRGAPT
jgi:hypothetical protein